MGKIQLLGLKADQFRHPLDLQATQALRQLPGLDVLVRGVIGPLAEQFFYAENIASSVRVSDRQLPQIYELLQEAAKILDLEPPQVYVRQHPVPNAYTFAMRGRQPFMVIHTSLIELLTPPEIQAVIAHELGHLKCDHGVYLTLANILALAATQLPLGEVLVQNLQSQIMEWVRCAEFTCDRAALLVAQEPKVVASLLMKLSGGSPSLVSQLNVEAFIEQAHAYDAIGEDHLGAAIKEIQTGDLTHPLPVLRAREIDRWANSPEYYRILKGRALDPDQLAAPASPAGRSTMPGWRNW
ncbi:peptidase M48 [filamentous cyanobacterium CCP5]|nr:peptidase M48 [filamentous cyanobacterium CCP5]